MRSCSDDYHIVKGVVVDGVGEGAKYVRLYLDVISRTLCFKPYLGTLNIKIDVDLADIVKNLLYNAKLNRVIPPPSEGLGKVFALKAYAKSHKRCTMVYIVRPERTVHGNEVIELISDKYLRKYLDVKTGDEIELVLVHSDLPPCNCYEIQ